MQLAMLIRTLRSRIDVPPHCLIFFEKNPNPYPLKFVLHVKTLFSYFEQFSLPKVRKTRLQADFVTNNQILVVKIIKIRPLSYSDPPLIRFYEFFDPLRLLRT